MFSTRRELMAAGIGMAAWPAAAEARGVRFGVRTPLPNISLRERALLVARLGYDGIELGPEWLDQPASELRTQIAGTGVVVSAIVGSLQLLNPDVAKRREAIALDRKRLEMARELGAGFVIEVPVFGENKFPDVSPVMTPTELEDRLLIAGLEELSADTQRAGVTILLEPLTRKETHYMRLQSHGADVIRRAAKPGFKLLSDFYHMQMEESDIGETLTRVGNYTGYVHLADGAARTEPGSLPFDFRPGFRALKKHGYAGWLTVECKATDEPEAALGRALRYLKTQWAEA